MFTFAVKEGQGRGWLRSCVDVATAVDADAATAAVLLLLTLIIAGCVDVDCVLNGLSHTHTAYTHTQFTHIQGRTLEAA